MENDINNLTKEQIDEIIATKIAPFNDDVAAKIKKEKQPDVVLSKEYSLSIFSTILSCFQAVGLVFFIIVSMIYAITKYDVIGYTYLSVDSYMILNLSTYICLALTAVNVVFNIIKACILKPHLSIKAILQNSPEFVFLFIALIYTIISTYASIKEVPSYEGLLIYGNSYNAEGLIAVLMYAAIFITSFTIMSDKAKQLVICSMFISGLAATVIMFICSSKSTDSQAAYWFAYRLNAGIFNNSNHYGYFTCVIACLAAACIVFSKHIWQVVVASVMLVPFLLCLLVSKTLGSNLGYVFCIIFIIIAYCVARRKFTWKIVWLVILSAIVFAVSESEKFTNMVQDYQNLAKSIKSIIVAKQETGSTEAAASAGSSRWGLWLGTLKVCEESPWLGKGLDCYYYYNRFDNSLDMPHNEYIQLASNVGIPVLILYLAAIISTFVRAIINHKRLSNTTLICLAVAFGYCVSAFFGNTFTYTYPYFMIFLGLAIPKINKDTVLDRAIYKEEYKYMPGLEIV